MTCSGCSKLECFISEEISGDIQLKDPCLQKVIWEGVGVKAFVTIKIQNSSKNPMCLIITSEEPHFTVIYPCEERSISMPNVKGIRVTCYDLDNGTFCLGNFRLCIYHPICTDICKDRTCKEKWDLC